MQENGNDLIIQQLQDQVKDVFASTLNSYSATCKHVFNKILSNRIFCDAKDFN